MTTCVAVQYKGGCVLACDSRCTQDGSIVSDKYVKYAFLGSCTAVVAGCPAGLWEELQERPTRTLAALRKRVTDGRYRERGIDVHILAWDHSTSRLWFIDNQGTCQPTGPWYAIGSGGCNALGALDMAMGENCSRELAEMMARAAIQVACKRDTSSGGSITVITRHKKYPATLTES